MKNNFGFRFILNQIIKVLGGYTKEELKSFKLTILKKIKEVQSKDDLSEDEKLVLRQYRTDMLIHGGKMNIIMERNKNNFF